jgi:hypothetical protein
MSRAPGKPKEEEIIRPLLQRLSDRDVALRRVEGCYRLMRQSTQQAARVPESSISLCMRRDLLRGMGRISFCQMQAGRGSVVTATAPIPAATSDQGDRPSGCQGCPPARDGE